MSAIHAPILRGVFRRIFVARRGDVLPGCLVAVGQPTQRERERQLRLVSNRATVVIEVFGRTTHMPGGLLMKLRCQRVMLRRAWVAVGGGGGRRHN